jgi:hypothetical protein
MGRNGLRATERHILVRVKIERAKKHLADLERDIAVFRSKSLNVVRRQQNTLTGQTDELLNIPVLSFDAIAAAGDVIQNLRSALDHLAYQLVLVGGGSPGTHTCFPIAKDFSAYESGRARKVEGMRQDAIKAIDDLKPYKGGNDAFWKIHELNNIDKHRVIFTVSQDYLFVAEWLAPITNFPYWHKAESGDPHFAGIFDQQVEYDMQREVEEAITNSQVHDSNALLPTLHQLVEFVDSLVASFKPMLE